MERKESSETREYRHLPLNLVALEVKAASNGKAVSFQGYGSVWGSIDFYGDTMVKGAFADALKKRMPAMLFSHRQELVPGKYISAEEDSKGLLLHGELTPGHSLAKDLEASMRHGAISGLSIGGYTVAADWIEEDGKLVGRRIREFDLYEVSPVALPAEEKARVDASTMKSAIERCATIREVEAVLREQRGFSRTAAETLIGRVRDLVQGDPAQRSAANDALGDADAATLVTSIRSIQFPESLLSR